MTGFSTRAKRIKKAIKLISGYGMDEDLKLFLGGNSIELSYPRSNFKFVITKSRNNIVEKTRNSSLSTPFNLDLYTKTNVYLSSLCVYVEDTPILDQILAIAMFVKNGCEEMILEKANYFRLTKSPKDRELLYTLLPDVRRRYGNNCTPDEFAALRAG